MENMKSKFIILIVLIITIISILSINAFAFNYNGIITSYQLTTGDFTNGTTKYNSVCVLVEEGNGYLCIYAVDNNIENGYFGAFSVGNNIYIVSDLDFSQSPNKLTYNSAYKSSLGGNYTQSDNVTLDTSTGLYYSAFNYQKSNTATSYVTNYNSISDGLLAISNEINNSLPTTFNNVSIPAGNVAYISTQGSQILTLTTQFEQYSSVFSGKWTNITQQVGWTGSLPSGTVTFPMSSMTYIDWSKDGNTNVLGQTQSATASYQTVANQYFVIYNPLYQQYGQGNNYDFNGSIYVTGDMTDIKVYPLSGNVVIGQGLVSDSESSYDDYFYLQDDGNGNFEWIDQNGNVSNGPQTGGTSLLPSEATIQSLASQILQIISNIGQSIANIFNVGHQAIITLVGHATEFTSQFQALYSWLPAPIFSVLSAAIILAITIGIVKVFI